MKSDSGVTQIVYKNKYQVYPFIGRIQSTISFRNFKQESNHTQK